MIRYLNKSWGDAGRVSLFIQFLGGIRGPYLNTISGVSYLSVSFYMSGSRFIVWCLELDRIGFSDYFCLLSSNGLLSSE